MIPAADYPESEPFERFAVEVFSELSRETVVRRSSHVNVLLRMSMLTGLEMELDSILNLLCDMAAEIVGFSRAAVYFWEESGEGMRLRASRNYPELGPENFSRASVLNYGAAKLGRPLLLTARDCDPESRALLRAVRAESLLVVPLFVHNRAVGALQLFGAKPDSFAVEDAQFLWMLALVAESMLSRDHSNETLLRLAFTDFLTGLKSRGYFEQQLELELARAVRRGTALALLMVDIDHFKEINDSHGHAAGDLVLREFGTVIAGELRQIDLAARYGGEEFVLVLPETAEESARQVAQRLRRAVEQASFRMGAGEGNGEVHITVSIGGALFPEDAVSKKELLGAADAALYRAKDAGRNRSVFFADRKHRQQAS